MPMIIVSTLLHVFIVLKNVNNQNAINIKYYKGNNISSEPFKCVILDVGVQAMGE
jgi:hypothetical protein